jgi:hypothetical protein
MSAIQVDTTSIQLDDPADSVLGEEQSGPSNVLADRRRQKDQDGEHRDGAGATEPEENDRLAIESVHSRLSVLIGSLINARMMRCAAGRMKILMGRRGLPESSPFAAAL